MRTLSRFTTSWRTRFATLARVGAAVIGAVCLTATLVSAQSGAVPPPGMIGWWPADGNANDLVGSNDGSFVNGATLATGIVTAGTGQAFSFDGVDDGIVIPDDPSLDLTGAMSVAAWVNTPDHACTDPFGQQPIMFKLDVPTENGFAFDILCEPEEGEVDLTGMLRVALFTEDLHPHEISWPQTVPAGEWAHVGFTWDGVGVMKLFINGDRVHTATWPAGTIDPIGTNDEPLMIGRWAGIPFQGLIDEPQLYDREITEEQMAALYGAGSAGTLRAGCPYDYEDPVDAIVDLIDTVESFNLQQGISNSLDAKLSSALGALDDLNDNNNGSAASKLGAFLGEVDAQRGDKLTEAQADELSECGTWVKWTLEAE